MDKPDLTVVLPTDPIFAAKTLKIELMSDGRMSVEATGSDNKEQRPLSIREQRELLRFAMDQLEDQKMATFVSLLVDNLLKQQIKPDGFRMKSVKDFLLGK